MVSTLPTTAAWQIDTSHSVVEFAVKHMMFSTAKGRFGQFSGTINYDPANLAGSSVAVEIDANSVDTRDEKRDGHLRAPDFFDVEQYPTLSFQSTRIEPNGDSAFKGYGDLTIRGVTKPAVLDAEVTGQGKNPWGQEVIGFNATTKFKRSEFGIEFGLLPIGMDLLALGDEVKIELDLEFVEPADASNGTGV